MTIPVPPRCEPGFKPRPRVNSTVRYRRPDGFEMLCDSCHEWWPITLEFWFPKQGLTRCRGCHNRMNAWRSRKRYAENRVYRESRIASALRYDRENRDYRNAMARLRRWRRRAAEVA